MILCCDLAKLMIQLNTTLLSAVALGNKHIKLVPRQTAGHILFFERGSVMSVSYKKLWKMLIDKDMKKKDLCVKAGISSASVTKMGKGGHVTTEVLAKICTALDCTVDDIMEIIPEDSQRKSGNNA